MFGYILPTLKGYKRSYLSQDLLAGLMVAALTIPVAMGYAELAGLPAIYGLYASILTPLGYALFATSRQLIFGIDSGASAITGTAIALIGLHSPDAAQILAPVFALFVGLYLILFGLLKVGKYATFLSEPVMTGFITGVAITVLLGQFLKMLGLSSAGTDVFANLSILFDAWGTINIPSAILSFTALGIILWAKKRFPKLPITLIVLIGSIVVVSIFSLDTYGIKIVGEIPQGLPELTLPALKGLPLVEVAMYAFVISIVIFSDSLLTAKSFALRGRYDIDENRELIAFGTSSLTASITGCPPTSSSVSRTAMNEQYKGKTQMVSIVACVIIALVLIFFSSLLYYLPQPVLGAIVFSALINLLDVKSALNLKSKAGGEFVAFLAAIIGIIIVGVIFGIIVAVILSFIDYARRAVNPPQAILGKTIHGVVIYRFSAALYFANIRVFTATTLDLIKKSSSGRKVLIIDASGIGDIDVTAATQLRDWVEELKQLGVNYYFVHVLESFREAIKRHELGDVFPPKKVTKTTKEIIKYEQL